MGLQVRSEQENMNSGRNMNTLIRDYMDAAPAVRREMLGVLNKTILELFPEVQVDMKYKMPTYSHEEGWVAVANQKNYVSLYTCGYHHIKDFKEKHPKIKTGKGCINFRESDSIPIDDLKAVIHHAILHPKDLGH